MKRILSFLSIAAMAFAFASCDPDNKPNPDDPNKDKPGGDEPEEVTVNPIKITLDGAFSDWDAITDAVAKENAFVDIKKGGADDVIQVAKASTDADNLYIYLELLTDQLPNNETCTEWGNSWDGTPELGYGDGAKDGDDKFREVIRFYIDPDGNEKTGFYTQVGDTEGEPAIADLGCEMCSEWFCFFKPSLNRLCMAWNQTCIGPTQLCKAESGAKVGDPYGTFDYTATIYQADWPDAGDDAAWPLWGWQNYDGTGRGDNIAPTKDNFKPGAAASGVAKVEFSIEKKEITNLKDEDEELALGIIYMWGGNDQYVGPLRVQYSE